MDKLLSYRGADELLPAIEAVSSDDTPDLVIVREFISNTSLLDQLGNQRRNDESKQSLYEEVPTLHTADAMIAERWREVGYKDIQNIGSLALDQLRIGGIIPHIDGDVYGSNMLEIIAQASLCLSGRRIYSSELLPDTFKTADGNYDNKRFKQFTKFDSPVTQSINEGRVPRTSVDVLPGDLILMPHHPNVTLHSVTHHKDESSTARLLTWRAAR